LAPVESFRTQLCGLVVVSWLSKTTVNGVFAGPSSLSGSNPLVAAPSGAVMVRVLPALPDGAAEVAGLEAGDGAPLAGGDADGPADGEPEPDGAGVTEGAGA
jgi:hypothetical protein